MSDTPHPRPGPFDGATLRGFGVAAAVGALLAFSAAFGTGEMPLAGRLAYWLPIMLVGAAWGHFCARRVERFIDPDTRPWRAVAVLTAVITGPLAVMVWAATGLVFTADHAARLDELPGFLGPVLIVTLALATLNVFLARTPVQTHAAPAGAEPSRFPERLPFRLRGAAIRAVQAEDHYLRIHTERGSDLILMRMTDALAELEGLEGAQTHRSWWVARDAVRGVRRGDGRATLTLEGGLEAPVSRQYARALRAAGWY